ncbi:MAG: hypothetical protein AB8B60_16260 [Sulfitobacter sp.]
MRPIPISAALLLLGTPLMATPPDPVPLTYDVFEAAIPHVDLETCPATLPQENTFCRATLAHEEVHVFVFSEEGASPLIGFGSFDATRLPDLLN